MQEMTLNQEMDVGFRKGSLGNVGVGAAWMSFLAAGFAPSVHCHCHSLHPGGCEGCFPGDRLPWSPSEGMEGQGGDNRLQRAAPAGC